MMMGVGGGICLRITHGKRVSIVVVVVVIARSEPSLRRCFVVRKLCRTVAYEDSSSLTRKPGTQF